MEGVIGIELIVQSSYSCNFVCNDNESFRSEEEALIERKYVLSYNWFETEIGTNRATCFYF